MSDPYKKVQPGEPVEFSATAWNAFIDAAKAVRDSGMGAGGNLPSSFRDASIVRVKNETGLDLSRCSVVGLNGPLFTPTDDLNAFLREPTFRGIIPTSSHVGKFAILLEPALQDRVAKAFVAGVCMVQVDVSSTGHDFAEVVSGETEYIESVESGTTRILWSEGGTGIQWAIVRMGGGGGGGGGGSRLAVAVGDIPTPTWDGTTLTPGIGSAYFLSNNDPNWQLSASSVTVHHAIPGGDAIGSGSVMVLTQADSRWVVVAAACDAEVNTSAITSVQYYDGPTYGGGLTPEQEAQNLLDGYNAMFTPQAESNGTGTGTDTGTGFGGFF